MNQSTKAGLLVQELGVRYGNATAVDGLSLTAPPGHITALVGHNGAGKSSALLGIYGSVSATGSVQVGDDDLSKHAALRRARAGVALVPQGRQLFPKMSVLENLMVAADLLRLPRERVDEAMQRFPILHERRSQLAGVLSGGEQQMLVVTRALMAAPKVILLDETMTGLAPRIVAEIMETVTELAQAGAAVLVADPSLNVIKGIVDRGYVMVRGRIVAEESSASALDTAYQRAMGVMVAEVDHEIEEVDQEMEAGEK